MLAWFKPNFHYVVIFVRSRNNENAQKNIFFSNFKIIYAYLMIVNKKITIIYEYLYLFILYFTFFLHKISFYVSCLNFATIRGCLTWTNFYNMFFHSKKYIIASFAQEPRKWSFKGLWHYNCFSIFYWIWTSGIQTFFFNIRLGIY